MQNKIVDLTSEAISINTSIFAKSVKHSVDSSQQFVQHVSDQAVSCLNIKNYDDFVANLQKNNAFAIDQTQKSVKTATDLGNEAYGAYLALWQKVSAPIAETGSVKPAKAKAASA